MLNQPISVIKCCARLLLPLTCLVIGKAYASNKPVWELSVTTAQVDGVCLYSQNWLSVGGRYNHWELIRIDDPKNFNRQIGDKNWRFVRQHTYSFLLPKDDTKESWSPKNKYFFNLDVIDESALERYRNMGRVSSVGNPYEYVDNFRRDLKKPHLLPATMIRYVEERELYYLNRHNSFNPFKNNIEGREIVVPVGRSVCDLNVTYLMKNAKARYTKNIFGKRKLISDETTLTDNGKKTFAEEWLNWQ